MDPVRHPITALPGSEGVPLYVRMAASLRTRIYQGEWPLGARLPAFNALASDYGVALNTVRKAVEQLAAQSLVASGRGSGTRVTARSAALADPALRSAISDPHRLAPDHRIHVLSSRRVAKLPQELRGDYSPAPSYQRVHKTQSVDGMHYAVFDIYLASAVYARFPPRAERSRKLSQMLRGDRKTRVVRSRQELTIAHCDQASAALLHYPIAAPLVRVRRWRESAAGVVVYACTVLYRSDLFVWDTTQDEPDADHFGAHVVPAVRVPDSA